MAVLDSFKNVIILKKINDSLEPTICILFIFEKSKNMSNKKNFLLSYRILAII